MNISIIGSGSFGTAIAMALSEKCDKIKIYTKDTKTLEEININRSNKKYLPEINSIPTNIVALSNLSETIKDTKYIILAVPSIAIDSVSKQLKPIINDKQIIVNLAKGINYSTLERLSTTIEKNTNSSNIVILSGPSHAEEIAKFLPTTMVVSSNKVSLLEEAQTDLSTSFVRVYINTDLAGVEIGGAAKNIIALAAGVLRGSGYGDNTTAALIVRGLQEMKSIGNIFGASSNTFDGLTGIGDLIVTCTSEHSRNNRAGVLIATGCPISDIEDKIGMTVEGINACITFHKFAQLHKLDIPITSALYKVLFEGQDISSAIVNLLARKNKIE